MDEDGKPTQPTYHVSWECMATAYARRGSHLLLFSSGFIEVRNVDTGGLIQVIERRDVRPLRCGWAEHRMLVAATAGDAANDDGSRKENLVELIQHSI
jgi:RHO1 GDP-GTP exchange protein 1/2